MNPEAIICPIAYLSNIRQHFDSMIDLINTKLFKETHSSYSFFFKSELGAEQALQLIDDYKDRFTYLSDVESSAINLLDTCMLLLNIHKQIVNDAPTPYLKTIDFERIEFFHFNIQNYYIRISTIYDLLLIVCNNILRLGIREVDINEKHLINNKIYKNYDCILLIKDFKKLIVDIKPKRNTIIHRGYFEDSALDTLRVNQKNPDPHINRATSESEDYNQILTRYDEQMKILNKKTIQIVTQFLNCTGKYYKENFNNIPKNGDRAA